MKPILQFIGYKSVSIFQDISFRHRAGKENHVFKTKLGPDVQWKLQQVCTNNNIYKTKLGPDIQ